MDIKTKIEEYLRADDLLYIDIFMINGVSFNLYRPQEATTLSIETKEDYLRIYGNVDDVSRIDTSVPYEHITHINAAFGEDPQISEEESE